MSNIIKSIKAGFYNYVTLIGRARVRRQLLTFSDHLLADTGFSRELLEQGVGAWPWRVTGAAMKDSSAILPDRDDKKAVAELNAYSDAELADLGLSRAGINSAVRYGRPGLDKDDYRHAA